MLHAHWSALVKIRHIIYEIYPGADTQFTYSLTKDTPDRVKQLLKNTIAVIFGPPRDSFIPHQLLRKSRSASRASARSSRSRKPSKLPPRNNTQTTTQNRTNKEVKNTTSRTTQRFVHPDIKVGTITGMTNKIRGTVCNVTHDRPRDKSVHQSVRNPNVVPKTGGNNLPTRAENTVHVHPNYASWPEGMQRHNIDDNQHILNKLKDKLSVVQWNACSIKAHNFSKFAELTQHRDSLGNLPDIIIISETHLNDKSILTLEKIHRDWYFESHHSTTNGGTLIALRSTPGIYWNNTPVLINYELDDKEVLAGYCCALEIHNKAWSRPLTITSHYLPPHRAKTDLNAMQPVITGPHLLAGDINSHHRTCTWHT